MKKLINKVCTVYEDELWFYTLEEQNIILKKWDIEMNNLITSNNYKKIYFMNPLCFKLKKLISKK